MKAILGRKIGMTRIFNEKGMQIPVTLISVEPNIVTQVNAKSVQIALPEEKKLNKPQAGHLGKTKTKATYLREFALDGLTLGDKIDVSQFEVGTNVIVKGLSKGKGFAGTVKRHHFHLGPKTHGSNNYRQPGSIGSMYPQRVIKGRRMAGHLGYDQVTTKNLRVIEVDTEKNILFLKGAVPGPVKGYVAVWSEL